MRNERANEGFHHEISDALEAVAASEPLGPIVINQNGGLENRLKVFRESAALSQTDLAAQAGLPFGHIIQAEKLRRPLTYGEAVMVADALRDAGVAVQPDAVAPAWLQEFTQKTNPDILPSPLVTSDIEYDPQEAKRAQDDQAYAGEIALVPEEDAIYTSLNNALLGESDRNREIIHRYFSGFTRDELATIFGVSDHRISQIVAKILVKIKLNYQERNVEKVVKSATLPEEKTQSEDPTTQGFHDFLRRNASVINSLEGMRSSSRAASKRQTQTIESDIRLILKGKYVPGVHTPFRVGVFRSFAANLPLDELTTPDQVFQRFLIEHPEHRYVATKPWEEAISQDKELIAIAIKAYGHLSSLTMRI